jgi:hypothetical protein
MEACEHGANGLQAIAPEDDGAVEFNQLLCAIKPDA